MGLEEIVKKEYYENDNSLHFKTTPVAKVVLLSVLSGGLYDLILVYDYWKTLKNNFGYKVSPFWRAFWICFTNFKLFSVLNKYFKNFGLKDFNSGVLATVYLMITIKSNTYYFRYGMSDTTNWSVEILSTVATIFTAAILGFIQHNINKVNESNFNNIAIKNPWKVSNFIWIIILVVLTIYAYMPE